MSPRASIPSDHLPLTFAQVWEVGIGSLPLVLLVAMIAGAATSEQTGYQYSSTLPPWIVGSVITASVVTELGPLSTGFGLIGRARTARTLTGTSAELRAASASLGSILDKIDRGNGSLGRAVNDPTLYQALLAAASHVDEAAVGASALVRDLRARPGRYIRFSVF
jgi:hypothetical protein